MITRWKKRLADQSIGAKLNWFYAVLVIGPIVVLGIAVGNIMSGMMVEQLTQRSMQNVSQSIQAIQMSLEEINSLVTSTFWDSEMLRSLKTSAENDEAESFIQERLRSVANARNDIICLDLRRGDGRSDLFCPSDKREAYKAILQDIPAALFLSSGYLRGETVWVGSSDRICGVRRVVDFETLEDIGTLYMVADGEIMRGQFENMKVTARSSYVVTDDWGHVVFDSACLTADGQAVFTQTDVLGEAVAGDEKYYVFGAKSPVYRWTVYQYTPEGAWLSGVRRFQFALFGAILIFLSVLLEATRRFSQHITEPLRNMQGLMWEIRGGNFDIHADAARGDELGSLARTFNDMASRIRQLIQEDYQSKLLLREAEYSFLRAQINPHFLYNTLDSISWMAAMGGNTQVSKMSVALGRILRWSISNQEKVVTLGEDAKIAMDYLSIQKMRYGEELRDEFLISESAEDALFPKMVLQPLVENTIMHGFEEKEGDKFVRVWADVADGLLQVTIEDNGVGMSAECVRTVMAGTDEKSIAHHGVGIHNVDSRIAMMFGKEYGLAIESEPGRGTRMLIRIPAQYRCEEDAQV